MVIRSYLAPLIGRMPMEAFMNINKQLTSRKDHYYIPCDPPTCNLFKLEVSWIRYGDNGIIYSCIDLEHGVGWKIRAYK